MRRLATASPWITAIFSWLLATVLVSGLYVLWQAFRGQPIEWIFLRDAALMAAPLALFRAWRDSRSR